MRKATILLTMLMTISACGAVASSASAAEFYVGSKPLKTKPAEVIGGVPYAAETEGITENVPISAGYLEVAGKTRLACLKMLIDKGLMKAPSSVTASEVLFSSCKETLHTGCTLASANIRTVALKGTASTLATPKAQVHVEPQSGTLLAEISYTTTNPSPCYKAVEKLTGHFNIVFPKGQTELTPQLGTINSAAGELELNSEPATETIAEGEASIVSSRTFSFH
jgi:hypothetical protein